MEPRLIYLGSDEGGCSLSPGQSFALAPGAAVYVGRGGGASIVLPPPRVARLHALVGLLPGAGDRAVVCDLGSTNGTWVAGRRVEVAIVRPGDEIEVAGVHRFRFVAGGSHDGGATFEA